MRPHGELVSDFRDAVRYREGEFLKLLGSLVLLGAAAGYITARWSTVWSRSVTKDVLDGIAEGLPVGYAPVHGFPVFVLLGLATLFLFDGYKRLQGVILGGATVVVLLSGIAVGLFTWNWLAPSMLASLGLGVSLGLFAGGARKAWNSSRRIELKRGFRLLQALAVLVGLLMILEHHIHLSGGGPTVQQLPGLAVDLVAVGVVGGVLREFTRYELTTDVVILGPSRSGKTWFLTGLAYTFNVPDVDEPVRNRTTLTHRMEELYNRYDTKNFEAIGPTDTDTAVPMGLKTDTGGFFGGRLRIRSADYSGEKLADLDLDTRDGLDVSDNLRRRKNRLFKRAFDGDDVEWDDLHPGPREHGESFAVEDLLRVLIADADVVCLVLPLDAVLDANEEAWTDDALVDPLTDDDDFVDPLGTGDLNVSHDPPKRITGDGSDQKTDEKGYYDIYSEIRDLQLDDDSLDGDVIFLGTKADLLKKAYVNHKEDRNLPQNNWSEFREFVWHFASEGHTDVDFRPGGNCEEFFPLYFESEDERTENEGYIKPVQERGGEESELVERSPLRGLELLYRRLR